MVERAKPGREPDGGRKAGPVAGVRPGEAARGGERDNGGGIQVISRAAAILRALADEEAGLSLGQIAVKVGLPRSTVQRIVHALAEEGLLMAASPSGRVRLGMAILALANKSKIDIVEVAHPHLKALSEATGETVDLAVLRDDHLVFLDQVPGSHRLRAVSAVGETFPLHSTANGKASLALLDDGDIRRRLKNRKLTLADGTTRTIDSLLGEIATVRETGIAFDREEHSHGISAVGTAFRDPAGSIFAISIPAPTARAAAVEATVTGLILPARDRLRAILGT
jgi:DNA-binding IclR family transcriptional regulator